MTDEILLPDGPDVPGLRFRHFQAPDDFAGMAAANQATRDAAGQEEVTNRAMDLYGSLGFEIVSTTYDWAKPLPADLAGHPTETESDRWRRPPPTTSPR